MSSRPVLAVQESAASGEEEEGLTNDGFEDEFNLAGAGAAAAGAAAAAAGVGTGSQAPSVPLAATHPSSSNAAARASDSARRRRKEADAEFTFRRRVTSIFSLLPPIHERGLRERGAKLTRALFFPQ